MKTFSLQLFGAEDNVQTTTQEGMSAEMKEYYDANLIRHAAPNLVHHQFGQMRVVPKNGGKTVEFRKLSPLPIAKTPLTEGVTPTGSSLNWSNVTSTLNQYGDYVTVSDMLCMTAVDDNLNEAGRILGNQAGETIDSVICEVINSGTNVQYAGGKAGRHRLVGGQESGNDYMTVKMIKDAVRTLKRNKAKKIDGSYVGIIHPDVAYDLMSDPAWETVKTYADPEDLYNGEIGRMHGVRFVESTEAKVFEPKKLTATFRTLTYSTHVGKVITIAETITEEDAAALVGRKIIMADAAYTVASVNQAEKKITVAEAILVVPGTPEEKIIYPGEGGAEGCPVYSTLILGAEAYGVTVLEGGGLSNIIKQLGSGGTADPLDQRATTGWKAIMTAEILVDEYMVRVETTASYAR